MFTGLMAPRELANFRWMVQRQLSSTRSKMRSELASTLFHSCRKISLKQSAPAENDEPLLRGPRQRRPRQRQPRQMRAFSYSKRQAGNGSRLSHAEAVGCAAARARVDRYEGRLRRGRMWFLLRLDEWRVGE